MFTPEELRNSLEDHRLHEDLADVRRGLATYRLEQETLLDDEKVERLGRIVEAVLASAPSWEQGDGADVLMRAAEAAEVLAFIEGSDESERARLRTALLYELADMPMMAAAVIAVDDGPPLLSEFFRRRGAFASLAADVEPKSGQKVNFESLLRYAACEDALGLAHFEHDQTVELEVHQRALDAAAARINSDMSLTDVRAFSEVIRRRAELSTRKHAPAGLLNGLRQIGFPPELWGAQATALDQGILDQNRDAWGFAAPTGTGKTFLARLVILHALSEQPQGRVLYLVPTRALVHQVSKDLADSLKPAGIEVASVTPQLTALEGEEESVIEGARVLVLTPEKADMLLRIGAAFLNEVSLVIVDEAHHLEDGTRGVLLELYLARLKHALADRARYILLSAVAPNIGEVTEWIGQRPGFALVADRSTRMKVGVYKVQLEGGRNRGLIDYMDGTQIRLFERGLESSGRKRLAQLAERISAAGPVLVISEGPGTAEGVADALAARLDSSHIEPLSKIDMKSPVMQRLDSRLEREMYADVPLRDMVRHRVAYHHAGLPPRVREALEEAIREGYIRHVIATTTLADGVNFPFSTVIVETLAIRNPSFEAGTRLTYRPVTPRTFWNIAGRAGRPGYDHEGQVILFDPALRLDRVDGKIEPYTNPDIKDIPPVQSALATGLREMYEEVEAGELEFEALGSAESIDELPKRTQGIVNLVRVGLAHAKATGVKEGAEEYFDRTYAASQLPESERAFGRRLLKQQDDVLLHYLEDPDSASVKLVAELGLSISTLSRLRRYVRDLEDWQLEKIGEVLRGGQINFEQLPYVLGPVLKRMAELEGNKLSGFYSEMVADWCRGKPFLEIRQGDRTNKLEDLIKLMYSRIQYILPWGLYAMDRFVEEEAVKRVLNYGNEVNMLAYLVDAGVPDLAALRLTTSGFERTDASRLARSYWGAPEARETTDIVGWLRAQESDHLIGIVRGADHRRLDYDFEKLIDRLRGSAKE
jgi:hypothetical protein